VIALRPISRDEANRYVAEYHSHHKPVVSDKFRISAVLFNEPDMPRVGVVIAGRPSARLLDDGRTLEVTRLCCRGKDKNVASRLLAASTTAADAMGYIRVVSYIRKDESGICYEAAGWVAVAEVKGQPWTHGGKSTRWLPGFYEPSTEIVDRVRWEWRPPQAIRAVCKCVAAMGRWAALQIKAQRRAA
jgi:hypothetical protein